MDILDSGDPVPAKAGNRSDAQTPISSQLRGMPGDFGSSEFPLQASTDVRGIEDFTKENKT